MIITFDQLKQIAPGCKKVNRPRLEEIAKWMNEWFPRFNIDTVQEIRHFVAQFAHESDSFNALEEYATGRAYEGRKDLGNVYEGDGVRFKGRGILQITGRANYKRMGEKLNKPKLFISEPRLLAQPEYAVWSACVYIDDRDLCTWANMPDTARIPVHRLNKMLNPLEYITWRINGGFNGLEDRKKFYERAKGVII